MRRSILIAGFIVAGALAILYGLGGFDTVHRLIEASQRELQSTLASAVRRLRAGDPGALAALMLACFSYGFIHAAGPGHGKVLIAGYGVGRRVPLLRLSLLAVMSSLAQAVVAIALVLAGVTLLSWTREQVVNVTEDVMRPLSYGAILALGLWLVWRGLRKLIRQRSPTMVANEGGHADHQAHDDHVHDDHCGHVHGPSLQQAEAVSGLRDGFALIVGIAMRPCTGALFLLILTWQMGIFASGVAGVLTMGVGTASVTVFVAVMAVWAREGALASLPGARIASALPLLELGAGLVVALVAGQLLLHSL